MPPTPLAAPFGFLFFLVAAVYLDGRRGAAVFVVACVRLRVAGCLLALPIAALCEMPPEPPCCGAVARLAGGCIGLFVGTDAYSDIRGNSISSNSFMMLSITSENLKPRGARYTALCTKEGWCCKAGTTGISWPESWQLGILLLLIKSNET